MHERSIPPRKAQGRVHRAGVGIAARQQVTQRLRHLRVDGFRSLRKVDLELGDLSASVIREVPAFARMKASAAPIIAGRIGLPRLRVACPHFNAWVSRLERLGEEA